MTKLKILVVGGNSSLAKSLLPTLLPYAEVFTAGRVGCDVYLDLQLPLESFILPKGIDLVINTAAHFGGNDSFSCLEAASVNSLGSLKLVIACSQIGVQHFINISSSSVTMKITSPHFGIYSLSKRQADELIYFYCQNRNIACTILRPSQLYGDDETFLKHQPFLRKILNNALNGENIAIHGTKNASRNLLHIDDFCNIILRVIQGRIEGTYLCSNPIDTSLLELSKVVVKALGSTSKIVFDASIEDTPDYLIPFDDTLYTKIGYFPRITIEEGLNRLVTHKIKN